MAPPKPPTCDRSRRDSMSPTRTIPVSPESEGATTMHHFSRIPPTVRFQIWRCALKDHTPWIVELGTDPLTWKKTTKQKNNDGRVKLICLTRLPEVLLVCRESRQEALWLIERNNWKINLGEGTWTYLNPSSNGLYLNPTCFGRKTSRWPRSFDSELNPQILELVVSGARIEAMVIIDSASVLTQRRYRYTVPTQAGQPAISDSASKGFERLARQTKSLIILPPPFGLIDEIDKSGRPGRDIVCSILEDALDPNVHKYRQTGGTLDFALVEWDEANKRKLMNAAISSHNLDWKKAMAYKIYRSCRPGLRGNGWTAQAIAAQDRLMGRVLLKGP